MFQLKRLHTLSFLTLLGILCSSAVFAQGYDDAFEMKNKLKRMIAFSSTKKLVKSINPRERRVSKNTKYSQQAAVKMTSSGTIRLIERPKEVMDRTGSFDLSVIYSFTSSG